MHSCNTDIRYIKINGINPHKNTRQTCSLVSDYKHNKRGINEPKSDTYWTVTGRTISRGRTTTGRTRSRDFNLTQKLTNLMLTSYLETLNTDGALKLGALGRFLVSSFFCHIFRGVRVSS